MVTIDLKEKPSFEKIIKVTEVLKMNNFIPKEYCFSSQRNGKSLIRFEGIESEEGKWIVIDDKLYKSGGMDVKDSFGMYEYLELDK